MSAPKTASTGSRHRKGRVSVTSLFAVFELLLAAGFWGFGFVASAWALDALDASEITFMRFAMAFVVGLPFLLRARARKSARFYLRLSALPAFLLVATLLLQTWGLNFTSATKSGFITTLYVVFVPLLEAVLVGRRLSLLVWLCVAGSMVGALMIVGGGLGPWNIGDLLTLACAVTAAFQIYWMGVVSGRVTEPFVFNIYQCAWSLVFALPFVLGHSLPEKLGHVTEWPLHAVGGLISLALGSTILAFFLQVRAQARLSATVSSLMFLLESPFAMVFAIFLLKEHLRQWEAVGAGLIFVSALVATTTELGQTSKE